MPDDDAQADGPLAAIRGNEFDSQTSQAAHALGIEKARAAAEEKRADALMTAATAELILDSLQVRHIDVVTLLDAAVSRTAMKVLTGEVPIRNGSDAAAVVREFTAARIRLAGDVPSDGGGWSGDASPEEKRENVRELRAALEARSRELEEAIADTEGPTPEPT